ncbi:FAD-dependent oxidoreductase [Aminobacter carboxidus]|uniref:FAD-dependent oxidoreductase n=1 Tax=Aminobacter carboxidus TaxID=376165 RepID=A0ABR9GQX2_9HYPH|nr:FAD-dependent oxidoreductase [Aminobacter carboxidus]MBE1206083.1 FAD-dependent oxidoreductase [Aminobacter carboxidus]
MIPARADVVIIGGGIIGCSIAYHLAKLGITDTVLLERRQLCCGTTWHSVGSVAELRGSRRMTELARYTAELYRSLEAETGQATGYKKTGSIMLALNKERLMEMERTVILARAFGQEAEMISLAEVSDRCPQVRVNDALAGLYLPTDGRTNPIDTTQALAKGARLHGAKILENIEVVGLDIADGKVCGVRTEQGPIAAEIVVLAAGMWSRGFAARYGVSLPLQAAEHFYAVTENIDVLQRSMPFIRVPDESTYYKEDAGKLLFGCLEKQAKPWALDGIPKDFCFDALPEDLDHFEPILTAAVQRFPLLEKAGIQLFFNGPESFTPDGNALLGETPELQNLFVACGMNTVGVMSGGGMGKMMAEWIRDRRRPEGFAEFDVARISPFQSGRSYLRDRTTEALGVLYDVGWPNREYTSGRGGRRSPLHQRHVAANAVMGNKAGWEVPLVYAPVGDNPVLQCSYGRQNWVPWAAAECRIAREAVALFDLSAHAKLEVRGAEAVAALDRISASPIGEGVSKALLLTESGNIQAVVTVVKIATDHALLLSPPGSERILAMWLKRHAPEFDDASLREATSGLAALLVLGPNADKLLSGAGARLAVDSGVSATTIGYAPAWLAPMRVGLSGGWLTIVATEFAVHSVEALEDTLGEPLAMGGSYALEAMRIGAAEPAWPSELDDTVSPVQAGLEDVIAWSKPDFIGRIAIQAQAQPKPALTRLVRITLKTDAGALYRQEGILRDGRVVGLTTSGAWCHQAGAPVAIGYVSDERGIDERWFEAARFEIDMPGGRVDADCSLAIRD